MFANIIDFSKRKNIGMNFEMSCWGNIYNLGRMRLHKYSISPETLDGACSPTINWTRLNP